MSKSNPENRTLKQKNKAKARFFEAQWLDVLRTHGCEQKLVSQSKRVPDFFVVSNYYQAAAMDLLKVVVELDLKPMSMLEVGPALGRSCYELAKVLPTLQEAVLVEPSQLFFADLQNILLYGNTIDLLQVKGKHDTASITFNTASIAAACEHIDLELINDSLDEVSPAQYHDLVICLNVIDQCEHPSRLMQQIKDRVKPGGLLYLSCTYQWQKKLIAVEKEAIDDINEYFEPAGWKLWGENELEYKLRYHERFAHAFLSHGVIYQKALA